MPTGSKQADCSGSSVQARQGGFEQGPSVSHRPGNRALRARRCCQSATVRRCHRCPGQTQPERSPECTERAPGAAKPSLSPAGPDPTARRRSPAGPARCGAARGGPAPRPGRGCRERRRDSRPASGTGRGDAGPARRPRTATARRTPRSPRRRLRRCRRSPRPILAGTRMGRERRSPPERRGSAAPPAWPRRHRAPSAARPSRPRHRQMAPLPPSRHAPPPPRDAPRRPITAGDAPWATPRGAREEGPFMTSQRRPRLHQWEGSAAVFRRVAQGAVQARGPSPDWLNPLGRRE